MKLVKSIKVCEYSRSRSFHDDFILQDQASGERSQDQWSSGLAITWQKFCVALHQRNQIIAYDALCEKCMIFGFQK